MNVLALFGALLLPCLIQTKQLSFLPITDVTLAHISRFVCPQSANTCSLPRSTCAGENSTGCTEREVVTEAGIWEEQLRSNGGNVDFFQPLDGNPGPLGNDHKRQATGVAFCITANSLALVGSATYTPLGPPGWEYFPEISGGSPGRTRGHLWGETFGGPGQYYLNIVTLWSDVNQKVHDEFECKVKTAFPDLNLDVEARVYVSVQARYGGGRLSPAEMVLLADVEYLTKSGAVVKEPWMHKTIFNVEGAKMSTVYDRSSTIKAGSAGWSAAECTTSVGSPFISALSFFPSSSESDYSKTGWEYSTQERGPIAISRHGEVLFSSSSQTEENRYVQLKTRQTYVVGKGLSFQFLVRVHLSSSNDMRLRLPGGIILRSTAFGKSAAYVEYSAENRRFEKLSDSSALIQGPFVAVHVVYTSYKTVLFENGLKKFERDVTNPESLAFVLRYVNVDLGPGSSMEVTNIVVTTDLNLRDA